MSNWVYHFAGFVLDPAERTLHRAGQSVALTPKAFDVLLALVERRGRLVGKDELLSCVWPETFVEETNLTYNISVLRKSLGDSAETPHLIENIPKRGYRFIAEVSAVSRNGHGIPPDPVGETAPGHTGISPETRRRSWRFWSTVSAAVALLLAGGWVLFKGQRQQTAVIEKSLVLIARFENNTEDAELDGVLESVLQTELVNSRYLGVASQQRINDVLRLMRRPPAAKVPAALVGEICQRDPAIRGAIAGSIRKVGSSYLLTAEIIQPGEIRVASSVARTAVDRNAILPTAGSLAAAVRESLVENLLHRRDPEEAPRRVTTNSLSALKLYGDAVQDGFSNRWPEAEVLLRRAVEMDPQFASAHIMLAWAIRNQRPAASAEFMPFAQRAFALSQGTSDHESMFIGGSYYSLGNDHLRAIPFYEALVRDYPEDLWALRNLLVAYAETRQYAQASQFSRHLTVARPNDPAAYLNAAPRYLCQPDPDLGKVQLYLDRGLELARNGGNANTLRNYQIQRSYYLAVSSWAAGDVRKCKSHLDDMAQQLPLDDTWSGYAGLGYLTLGMAGEADKRLRNYPNLRIRLRWGVWRALLAGDTDAARQLAGKMGDEEPNPLSAIAMMRAGEVEAAAKMVRALASTTYADPVLVARYELAMRQTGVYGAVDRLTDAVRSLSESEFAERWLAARLLADAHVAHGDLGRAVSVLEGTNSPSRACGGFLVASFWPQARYDLMQLYRRQGRLKEAGIIREELESMLALADRNYVVRAALDQR